MNGTSRRDFEYLISVQTSLSSGVPAMDTTRITKMNLLRQCTSFCQKKGHTSDHSRESSRFGQVSLLEAGIETVQVLG